MCTAVSCTLSSHYFGRNLDVEGDYGEKIVITPRNFNLTFKKEKEITCHYAMIGVAKIEQGYPLYFDGTNEKGLSIAALNFPGNAVYNIPSAEAYNITPFEFIPWILGKCETVASAKKLLENLNITDINFSENLPLTPLHWIISDKNESVVVESVKEGLRVYDNWAGVLTNNPTFDMQIFNLNNYMGLSPNQPENKFFKGLKAYSLGMGALGLPGDMSSASRFVRAAFVKFNSFPTKREEASVTQFFHILGSVSQPKGCTKTNSGKDEYTSYTTCCNTDTGQFYYKTYENWRINCVSMFSENLDGKNIISYPILRENDIYVQNREK